MANTYNTRNPLGSTAVKDLYDNASNMDDAMNSTSPAWIDRFGLRRQTWNGLELLVSDFLAAMGFEPTHLTYVDGSPLTVLRPTQLIDRGGLSYKIKTPATFPVTLSGNWVTDVALVVEVVDSTLRDQLFAAGGASIVGFHQASADAIARTVQAKLRDGPLNPRDFGAVGNGSTNDTAAFNKCLAACKVLMKRMYVDSGTYAVDEASPGAGYCLLNKGVSVFGDGALRTVIVPVNSLAPTVTFMKVQPESGQVLDFLDLADFMIYQGEGASRRGGRALLMDMTFSGNATAVHLHGLYLSRGNDLSLHWVTDPTANLQGGPANSVIERCSFWEGVNLVNHGDSVTFRNNVFRSTAGSGRPGLVAEGVNAAGGQPAQLIVSENNFDCDGGSYIAKNGLSGKFTNNNCEQTHGSGSGSGAMVDIDGNASQMGYMEISGNNFGAFGTAAIGQAIRVNNAVGVKIRDNRLLSAGPGFASTGILITALALDTELSGNEISTGFTNPVIDVGVGTRGVNKLVSLLNGFGAVSGDQVLSYIKDADGAIWLGGSVSCPGSASGQLVGSLPAGMRPAATQRVPVTVLAAGAYATGVLVISTAGDLVFYCSVASPSQFFVNVRFGGSGYVIGNL